MTMVRADKSRFMLFRSISMACVCGLTIGAADAARAAQPGKLTLYTAQHEQVVDMLTAQFTKETGIKVLVHQGEGPEIASQILAEGAHSPADVFFTENSPELVLLGEHRLLAPVAGTTLALMPARDNAPDGTWIGLLARENVLTYNSTKIAPSALPASLLDLAQPAFAGQIAIAPSDADFLPLVSAMIKLKGTQATRSWLAGLKKNAVIYDDDEAVVAAVNRGSVATGIINSYYWMRLATELGAANMHSAIHHFAPRDVGALVNISGAGILKTAPHGANAQRFVAFLASREAQTMLGKSDVDFEYPLRAGVSANPQLTPLDQLSPPDIGPADLGDDRAAAALIRDAGLV